MRWGRMKPKLFIGSSAEQLDLAYAAQEGLEHDVEATVWSQGVFTLSKTAMASLIDVLDESDFGLFILSPDDVTALRDKSVQTVRDNVIFELGLFIGRLGSDRCFFIIPRGAEDLHLPTDLLGLTPATYDADRQDGNMVAALGPACNRMRKAIAKLGTLIPQTLRVPPPSEPQTVLCSDKDDCVSLIQSWMGSRAISSNTRVMRYDDVDRELKLQPGSARQYIEEAARHWNYIPVRKGKDTILFKDMDGL
ncbi:MAG TPA: nucleotide-binding protein [Rhizomicrobium sp.]|nr:nucleotide-binding protein [Rhizomicrobium sp.]